MKAVVVGFNTKEENSVYYDKLPFRLDTSQLEMEHALGKALMKCKDKGAEFVSVRFIP